jgi:glycosyltransferase involved in cell wall biosynthesis
MMVRSEQSVNVTNKLHTKLLILIPSLTSGGAERVATDLANFWSDKGWTVTILTIADNEDDFYPLDQRIKRTTIGLPNNGSSLASLLLNNFKRVTAIRQVLVREKPVVTISFMEVANCLLAVASIGLAGVNIGTQHNHPPKMSIPSHLDWLRKRVYSKLDAVTALTQKTADHLAHTVGGNIHVIPNFINYPLVTKASSISASVYKDKFAHIVLAVGSLTYQKGFSRLIDCFSNLASTYIDWCLVIVGEGKLRCDLEEQIRSHNLDKQVFLPGRTGNVADFYKEADIFAFSSHYEGFGLVLAEAMTYGVPAVSFDCDTGPSEIITNNQDGLLIPQDDAIAFTEGLKRLIDNEGLRKELGKNATRIREKFSPERVGELWDKLFSELSVHNSPLIL